jgi:toxoflavin biosynthesis protein ToxD
MKLQTFRWVCVVCLTVAAGLDLPSFGVLAGTMSVAGIEVIEIPAGPFIAGSDAAERERAYLLDEAAYGHSKTRERGWYDDEDARHTVELDTYFITRNLITNAQYQVFVAATGHRVPDIDKATWDSYGLIHPYERTRQFAWIDGRPPVGREDHPVVLVNHDDAEAFARWLSDETGRTWRLPTEMEWQKAARGTDGRMFPWGDTWDPNLLNTHDAGPFTTLPVGSFPAGASPYGMLDAAGQVFEWTSTEARPGRYWVKGGSWDDRGCGVCRPADRHTRPAYLQHILVGFRLVLEP